MTINNPNNFDPAWSSLDQSQGHNLPTQQIKQVDTRRDSVVTKKNRNGWSLEQLAIIRKAIDEGSVVRGSRNQTYQHIADEINKYDGIDNGKHHDATACRKMAHTLKVEDQIRKTADPSKTMTSDAIAIKTKRPILGDDLERLKKMCEKSLPLEKIAIKLGRNIGICRSAIKKLKNEKEIEKDQVTPQSAVASELQESFQPVDYYPDPGDELLFNFIPLPAHHESTTLSEQKIVIPHPPAKKRKAPAEGATSIPKKVKIPTKAPKKDKGYWSPNQNAAVLRAIERADSWRVNHELLLEEVNALAVKGDGGLHSKEGCYSKVYKVQKKIKNQLNITD